MNKEATFFEFLPEETKNPLQEPEFERENIHFQLHDKMKVGTIYTPILADIGLGTEQTNISSLVYTKLNLGYVITNFGKYWSTTNKRFTAPVSGYYHFDAVVAYDGGSDDLVDGKCYYAVLMKNGATILAQSCSQSAKNGTGGAGEGLYVPISKTLKLAKKDYVELFAYHNAGIDTIDVLGSNTTYLNVSLVGYEKTGMNSVPPPPSPPSN